MTELLDRPATIERDQSVADYSRVPVSAENFEAADIPTDTFQFDYNKYVEDYEARKIAERLEQLTIIGAKADELAGYIGTEAYEHMKRAYDAYVEPINQRWGEEFDTELIDLLCVLLIKRKDLTLVVRPGTQLFWLDRFKRMIEGIPYAQDELFISEDNDIDDPPRQLHPGRPDKDKIQLHVYTVADSKMKMQQLALTQAIDLAA